MSPAEIPGLAQVMRSDIYAHAFSTTDSEVGGVLIGRRAPKGPPHIAASIRAHHAAEQASELTFTQESWEYIHGVMDRDYPEQEIVGWYHTHPGYGLFLSEQDRFIHQNFFQQAGQIAVVVDPIAGEEAVFRWNGDEIVEHARGRCRYEPPETRARAAPSDRRDAAAVVFAQPHAGRRRLVEINPETSRPTLVAALYLLVIGLCSGVVAWELFLR